MDCLHERREERRRDRFVADCLLEERKEKKKREKTSCCSSRHPCFDLRERRYSFLSLSVLWLCWESGEGILLGSN